MKWALILCKLPHTSERGQITNDGKAKYFLAQVVTNDIQILFLRQVTALDRG